MSEMHVGRLTADPHELDDLISRVANIEGDFHLAAAGEALYSEEGFPVVELARQLALWSTAQTSPESDFEFDSMFFEEHGMIWIRRAEHGWRLGSIEQLRPDPRELSWAEVRDLIHRFINEVIEAGNRDLGLDLTPTIGPS